jgi:DNA polymerase-3 subunit alpha
MPAVAITDTSNLFGALEFSQYCVGRACSRSSAASWAGAQGVNLPPDPVVLLAQTKPALPICKSFPR